MTELLVQGSPEWFAARIGRVTASRVADVVARTKSGWGASRANYMAQLIAERLTGTIAPSYTNAAMQWGTDHQDEARVAYEFYTDERVEAIGFVSHPKIPMTGASPDGLVGGAGMIEIKCPATNTHIETLLGAEIPNQYLLQMQWQMACKERAWCDYVSYDPRMPENMRLHVFRVQRSPEIIGMLEHEIPIFLNELDAKVAALTAKYGKLAA